MAALARTRRRTVVRSCLAAGLVGIATGLVVVAVLGPLLTGALEYRVTDSLRLGGVASTRQAPTIGGEPGPRPATETLVSASAADVGAPLRGAENGSRIWAREPPGRLRAQRPRARQWRAR